MLRLAKTCPGPRHAGPRSGGTESSNPPESGSSECKLSGGQTSRQPAPPLSRQQSVFEMTNQAHTSKARDLNLGLKRHPMLAGGEYRRRGTPNQLHLNLMRGSFDAQEAMNHEGQRLHTTTPAPSQSDWSAPQKRRSTNKKEPTKQNPNRKDLLSF